MEQGEREQILGTWIHSTWGYEALYDPLERVNRLLEEVVELAQAEGLESNVIYKTVEHVLGREVGDPKQEIGGVAICLRSYALAKGWSLSKCELYEIIRAVNLPVEKLIKAHDRKAAAGIAPSHPDNIELPPVRIEWG